MEGALAEVEEAVRIARRLVRISHEQAQKGCYKEISYGELQNAA